MTDPITIEQIFSAFVGQDSFEEAAFWMANLAASDPEFLAEITVALTQAINSGPGKESSLIAAVHSSHGYYASDAETARRYSCSNCSRATSPMGPNNSFKPKPLRGSA
jgi:hypothetical protein